MHQKPWHLTISRIALIGSFVYVALQMPARADDAPPAPPAAVQESTWLSDYAAAMSQAGEQQKMLLVYFHDLQSTPTRQAFEEQTLADEAIRKKLASFVLAKLPLDVTIQVQGKPVALLEHPAFAEMRSRPGIAVIDLAHQEPELHGHVVSAIPFAAGKYSGPASNFTSVRCLSIVLDLPPGTLTQRTMIFAVRMHPEKPASTTGEVSPLLLKEAQKQSQHQAAILVQGHHNWDSRFERISMQLPGGGIAQEVVAESWPNEPLVEAAIDCVDSWHHSPGHWGAVRSEQAWFGYDIQRGRNGIWYATGIFGRHN